MINAKVKVITGNGKKEYEPEMNKFFTTIDIRQVIKTETTTTSDGLYRTIIYYVNYEDIREVKIDNVLKF
jgi:hypothetical protein